MYLTKVELTRFEPVRDAVGEMSGLLVYGQAMQSGMIMTKHPWKPREIISALSQGDYHTALIAVGVDSDFSYALTLHHWVLITIVIITSSVTIFIIVISIIYMRFVLTNTKRLNSFECSSNLSLSRVPSYGHLPATPFTNFAHPPAADGDFDEPTVPYTPASGRLEEDAFGKQSSVRIINPLRTTNDISAESKAVDEAHLTFSHVG
ncbi:unnamed protein product [Phytomonas sp. Hart1]|nr:unnamed protein product [Phytomonas sp. Hart1]|eukprot:CCW68416.1 unnamed protein product [Phytomonas sp. isolate Hart1]